MSTHVQIGNKKFFPIREASGQVSYSRDYVTRLAREGKIMASQIERQWYVDVDSLKNYAEVSRMEAEIRKTHLREQRKQEQLFRSAQQQQKPTNGTVPDVAQAKAVVAAGSVLAVGLLVGVFGFSYVVSPADFNSVVSLATSGNQNSQTAANAKALVTSATQPEPSIWSAINFFSPAKETTSAISDGILIIPVGANTDPAAIFSDEVIIRTAPSGEQTAVLIDSDGVESSVEVPFRLVPVEAQ